MELRTVRPSTTTVPPPENRRITGVCRSATTSKRSTCETLPPYPTTTTGWDIDGYRDSRTLRLVKRSRNCRRHGEPPYQLSEEARIKLSSMHSCRNSPHGGYTSTRASIPPTRVPSRLCRLGRREVALPRSRLPPAELALHHHATNHCTLSSPSAPPGPLAATSRTSKQSHARNSGPPG
jgi:hypothetical protein